MLDELPQWAFSSQEIFEIFKMHPLTLSVIVLTAKNRPDSIYVSKRALLPYFLDSWPVNMQVFLIGVCLPFYIVHSLDKPLNIWDFVAVVVCICGVVIAYFADTQLHEFVIRNNKLKELGKPMVPNLDRGLWCYSRHPNYFGEQLWWWGLVIFAWNLGHGWTCVGSLINSFCLIYVTVLVEQRMLKQQYRAEAYRLYRKTTSVWIPWFKSSAFTSEDKKYWSDLHSTDKFQLLCFSELIIYSCSSEIAHVLCVYMNYLLVAK